MELPLVTPKNDGIDLRMMVIISCLQAACSCTAKEGVDIKGEVGSEGVLPPTGVEERRVWWCGVGGRNECSSKEDLRWSKAQGRSCESSSIKT